MNVLFFPVRRKIVDCTRRGGSSPGTLIANICPDPALLHAFAQPFVSQRAIQHPDRGIVRMKEITCHDRRFDPFDERLKDLHGATTPIAHRAVGNVDAHAGEDLVQTV